MKCKTTKSLLGRRSALTLLVASALFPAAGCAVVDVQRSAALDLTARWALLPILDYTDTTLAGARVEDPLCTLVRARWSLELVRYPAAPEQESLADLDERQRYRQALEWARKDGYAYGLTGSVNEWKYRSGADGEAAVGLTIQVVDVRSGRVVWSATGARAGWGRETASSVAQKLIRSMLSQLGPMQQPPARGSGRV
jgi:hypothetical protein